MQDPGLVVVNGRFLAAPVTGVQRLARELVARIPAHLGTSLEVVLPGGRSRTVCGPADLPAQQDLDHFSGVRAHLWEQMVLPVEARRLDARLVLNLCNAAPVALGNSVVGIADTSPLTHPAFFSRAFTTYARRVWPVLVRRAELVVTISERSRTDIARLFGVSPERILVVQPAAADAFSPDGADRPRDYCLTVGGHDRRKNVGFLVGLWPEVRRRLGLELVVTRRTASLPHGETPPPAGVQVVDDPDDETLAELYRGAFCVLSPSVFEGFGLPLLEGMACGTPFLSTDAGAACELAIDPRQILPLDPSAWFRGLQWLADGGRASLTGPVVSAAHEWSWEDSARRLAHALAVLAA